MNTGNRWTYDRSFTGKGRILFWGVIEKGGDKGKVAYIAAESEAGMSEIDI